MPRPPRYPGERMLTRSLTATLEQWHRLCAIGGGNASEGLRLLIERTPCETQAKK